MKFHEQLRDRDESPLAVFYDPAQKIFERKWELLERAAQHEIRVNFRNTRSIARAVSDVGGVHRRRSANDRRRSQDLAEATGR
jgi:hypothetical protein